MQRLHTLLFPCFMVATAFAVPVRPVHADGGTDSIVDRAVADTTRLARHTARDAARMPAQVLKVAGIKPGDTVADLATFGGYYTAIASRIVGPKGTVYAADYGLLIDQLPQFNLARLTPAYMKDDPRDNIVYSVFDRFADMQFPKPVDAMIIALNYHDTLWNGEDRPAMNAAMFRAVRPGGRLVVIDHAAKTDAGAETGKTIHRVNPELVKREVEAAGFRLVASPGFLANPDDPRDIFIVDPSIRGKTDRFVFVFEKPE